MTSFSKVTLYLLVMTVLSACGGGGTGGNSPDNSESISGGSSSGGSSGDDGSDGDSGDDDSGDDDSGDDDSGDDDSGDDDSGDDGNGEDPEESTLVVTPSTVDVKISENESESFLVNINYTGDSNVSLVLGDSPEPISIYLNGNTVVIESQEIFGFDVEDSVDLVFTDGNLESTVSVNLTVENTSRIELIQESVTLANRVSHFSEQQNDDAITVSSLFFDIAYLSGFITEGEKDDKVSEAISNIESAKMRAGDVASFAISQLNSALRNEVLEQETEIAELQVSIGDALNSYEGEGAHWINLSQSLAQIGEESIDASTLYFHSGFGYSFFYNNPELGTVDGNSFSFSEEYKFIEEIVISNSAICKV